MWKLLFRMLVVSCYWLLLLFQWCSRAKRLALIFQRRSMTMTVESDWGFGLCLRHPSITCLSSQNTQTKQSMVQKILRSNVQLTVIRLCSADPMLQQVQTDAMICTNLSHDVPFITIPSHLVNYPTMLMNVSIHFPTGGTRPYLSFNICSQTILTIKPLRAICKVQEAQLMDDLWSASHKARMIVGDRPWRCFVCSQIQIKQT